MEALAQDRPIVLSQLACERLYQLRLVRPGLTSLEQPLVGAARAAARQEIARRVAPLLSVERRARLDGLLEVGTNLGVARATWLGHLPVQASPKVLDDEIDKLRFLRELGADKWDLSALPAKRVAVLARWAQTASNQALAQSSEERRYPALLAFGTERLVGVIDGQAIASTELKQLKLAFGVGPLLAVLGGQPRDRTGVTSPAPLDDVARVQAFPAQQCALGA